VYCRDGSWMAVIQFWLISAHWEPNMPKIAPDAPTVILSGTNAALPATDRIPAPINMGANRQQDACRSS